MAKVSGHIWIEDTDGPIDRLHHIGSDAVEYSNLTVADVDDTPVNAATTDPISSNWAYDQAVLDTGVKILGYLGL